MAFILDERIAGIPCKIEVLHFERVAPWRGNIEHAPSDLDYYGYTEADYVVLDRRGRPAPWLERKMDEKERMRIEERIAAAFSE